MKSLLILISSAYILMGVEINWYHNFDLGLKEASHSNKKVILMLTAEHCKACSTMKETVFKDEGIISKQNNAFISIILDAQKDKIPVNIHLFGTPSFYLLNERGEIIDTRIGGSNLLGWNTYLDEISN